MKISKFHKIVNDIMLKIEDKIDHCVEIQNIDCEINNDVLTITFSENKKIVINKQEKLQELWMATEKNGYHFSKKQKQWICNRSGKEFWSLLEKICFNTLKKQINFRS
ncbi:iron donor protein CyaY [Buchnera aphidicola (Hormaphis cornu)]|nr:iron donor protein CyaY [Buchnera aphidicola (Hormaphis cornu)]